MGAAGEMLRRYYAAMDGRPLDRASEWVEELAGFFTDDATIRAGHGRAHDWRTAFTHERAPLPRVAAETRHEVTNVVESPDGRVACEVTVTYVLKAGGEVSLPGSLFARLRDGRFAEQHLYVDLSPVLAPR